MPRRLPSLVNAFEKYTDGKGSPALYRKWGGIFLVAACCERKVWLKTAKGRLYPNMYLTLVGGAGVGKSLATSMVYDFLTELNTTETPFHLAPVSVTKASLIDSLSNAERRVVKPNENPPVHSFNSLTAIPNELGVFIPAWDGEFMNTLTDLWDCKNYSETRRTKNLSITIPRVQLSIFSATTPAHLQNMLPEGAWDQGFMSRILLAYSGEQEHTDLFQEFDLDTKLHDDILHDMREVYRMWGGLEVTDEAKEAINEWARSSPETAPTHPKLSSYRARRPAHLLKLCIVSAIACDNDLIITLDHFAEALDWLVELETFMPDIFKSMKTGGDGQVMDECWHFAYEYWLKKKEPVPEFRLVSFLQERTPAHNVGRILEVMERAQLLTKQFIANGTGYKPKARKAA